MPVAVANGPALEPRELLEAGDVAKRLNLSYAMVYALTRAGRIEIAFTTPRGLKLYDPVVVEQFVVAREEARRARAMNARP